MSKPIQLTEKDFEAHNCDYKGGTPHHDFICEKGKVKAYIVVYDVPNGECYWTVSVANANGMGGKTKTKIGSIENINNALESFYLALVEEQPCSFCKDCKGDILIHEATNLQTKATFCGGAYYCPHCGRKLEVCDE